MNKKSINTACGRKTMSGFLLGCVAFVATMMFSNHGNAAAFKAEELFRPEHLMDIQVKLAPDDWEKLRNESSMRGRGFGSIFNRDNAYNQYRADITIDGVTIRDIGIRTKGFIGSLDTNRPSLKVKFDEYVDQSPIEGLDRLTLNNNKQDHSLASQFLTYKLFNKAGIPAPRVSYAKVTVNDEYLGVYSNVESVRSPFLKQHYGDDSGEFYEGTIKDFYPIAVEDIEAKNKRTRKDRSRARKLAKVLETQESAKLEDIEKLVDVDQFIRFWAMESLLGFWDGYTNNQNNYFAYSNPENDFRFHFMPWGADGAFVAGGGPFSRFRGGDGPAPPKSIYSQSMLANRLYQIEEIKAKYKTIMEDLLKNVWDENEITQDIHNIRQLTKDHLHSFQEEGNRGRGGFGGGGVEGSIERLMEFVENRRSDIESELNNWPVEIGAYPRIPMHNVTIGKLKGRFETTWYSTRLEKVADVGKTDLHITLNDETIRLSQVAVVGQPQEEPRFRGFGGPGRGRGNSEPRPLRSTITFQGIRENDGHQMHLILMLDQDAFNPGKKNDILEGSLRFVDPDAEPQENRGFPSFRGPRGWRLEGKFKLTDAGMEDGDVVAGTLDCIIQESRGGMFSNRGGRGGPPNGNRGGRGGPPISNRPPDS